MIVSLIMNYFVQAAFFIVTVNSHAGQTQHKDAERRLFAARGIASVTACVRPRQRALLSLPALAKLLNDPFVFLLYFV